MSRIIYTDAETEQMLKEIREKNPNFNLSEMVRQSLQEQIQHKTKLDSNVIEKNISDAKRTIEKGEEDLKFWEGRKMDYAVQLEMQKKEQEESKSKEEKQKVIQEQAKKNITDTFKEEMGREMTEFEFNQYQLEGTNIWAFCDRLKEIKV